MKEGFLKGSKVEDVRERELRFCIFLLWIIIGGSKRLIGNSCLILDGLFCASRWSCTSKLILTKVNSS